jgi:hypothetical protein
MGFFSNIINKIFHHSQQAPAGQAPAGQGPASTASAGGAAGSANASLQSVDVEKVLSDLAAKKGGGGNWRTSIVDLLKMLDLDSSLAARKELAAELNVRAGADGTAEQNIALMKAVWAELAKNGGKVPASLRD